MDHSFFSDPSVFDLIPDPEESGRIPVRGGAVWFRINGREHFSRGKTPLLCIHSGPGATHHYLLPLTLLATTRPVILYDQLDCGQSEHPGRGENWKTERFVSEIDALRDHLGLSELALFGHGRGATWAATYAVRRPPGLRALILASPFLSGPAFRQDAARLKSQLPAAVRDTLSLHETNGTTESYDYQDAMEFWAQRHLCRRRPWPACLQRSIDLFNKEPFRPMWGASESTCTGSLADFDLTARLADFNVPTWYVCGEHDPMTPDTVSDFARRTPGSRIDVIADASHMVHLEDPRLFQILAGDFLERATNGAARESMPA
jgi:proline-specific peptidase